MASKEEDDLVPLLIAAHALRLRYQAALDALLLGKLEGERVGGRWFVHRRSIERQIGARDE